MALGEPQENDVPVIAGGARVYVARQVAQWYSGAELGWEEDAWGGGFTFRHPDLGSC
jgi:Fe-S cluster assembly iron-binding protein IscA